MRTALLLVCLLSAWVPDVAATTFLDRPLNQWLRELETGREPRTRRSAAFALGRMGTTASSALSELARRVREDRDASVRDMSAQAIGEIVIALGGAAGNWDDCGPVLLKAAREDDDSRVKRSAVYALGAFGNPAAKDVLKAALADRSAAVRQNAAWAMGRLTATDKSCVESLRDRLTDDSALVRRDAAQALGNLARVVGRKSVLPCGRALFEMARKETDDVARKAALAALASVAGPEHAAIAEEIHPLLKKDAETARNTAFALAAVGGKHAIAAMPVLRSALSDSDPSVQALAAAGLAAVGPTAEPAVEDLARVLLESKDPVVRRNCVIALGQVGPGARKGVPAIGTALTKFYPSSDQPRIEDEVRAYAAEALSHIKFPDNEKAMNDVRKALIKDPHQEVRLRCVEALFQMRNPADLEKYDLKTALVTVLSETNKESTLVRYNCARVLALIYAKDAPDKVIEVLMHMLHNKEIRIFYQTKASIEGGTTEASSGKTAATAETGGDARHLAAEALSWLGKKAADDAKVMAALKAASMDAEPILKERAKKALEELGRAR